MNSDPTRREETPLLELDGLEVSFPAVDGPRKALQGIDLAVTAGEIVGLVGETGAGKSILARSIIGLLPGGGWISAGDIRYRGKSVVEMPHAERRRFRGGEVGLIGTNPKSLLNPVETIGRQIGRVLRAHSNGRREGDGNKGQDPAGRARHCRSRAHGEVLSPRAVRGNGAARGDRIGDDRRADPAPCGRRDPRSRRDHPAPGARPPGDAVPKTRHGGSAHYPRSRHHCAVLRSCRHHAWRSAPRGERGQPIPGPARPLLQPGTPCGGEGQADPGQAGGPGRARPWQIHQGRPAGQALRQPGRSERGAGRGRRLLSYRSGRDPGPGRRERIGQDHRGPVPPAPPAADQRHHPHRW